LINSDYFNSSVVPASLPSSSEVGKVEEIAIKATEVFDQALPPTPDPSAFLRNAEGSLPKDFFPSGKENSPTRTPTKVAKKSDLGSPPPITPSRISGIAPGVQPSPVAPKEPKETHYVDGIFYLNKKDKKSLQGKRCHSVVVGSPETEREFDRTVTQPAPHRYISIARKALAKGLVVPALKLDGHTKVKVLSSGEVQLTKHSKTRVLDTHGQPGNKAYFPVRGDDLVAFSKDGKNGLSMTDFEGIHQEFKRRRTGEGLAKTFHNIVQEHTSSSSSSSTQ